MKPQTFSPPEARIPVYENHLSGNVDMWMAACSGILNLAPIKGEVADMPHRISSWFVDPITISNSQYAAMVAKRTDRHIEEAGRQIHVHRYVCGRGSLETAGLPLERQPASVTLLDYSRPFKSVHTASNCESIFVPHTAIGYSPSDANHAPVYSRASTMGLLIHQEMDYLFAMMRGGAKFVTPSDVQRFLGCIEVAMRPDSASMSARVYARESLKRSIQRFIEAQLRSPDICVSQILQIFGVSRASLFRMFEPEKGVRSYINRRRIHRAVTDLAAAPHLRGQVHEVAERWGFSSDANFNRMVKNEFGVAPGGLFEMPISAPPRDASISDVHARMNRSARRLPQAA